MDTWVRASLILCVFGFLKEFRPSEPYVTQYLVGPWKNFTDAETNQQIYPVITYSNLSTLILVFLLTDLLRYKVVIVFGSICGLLAMLVLLYTSDIRSMQVMGFAAGTFYSADIAYFTYIYAKVDRKHFQKVTSYTQSAFLMGRFLSCVTGQVLVSTELTDYEGLAYISLGALLVATLWSVFLPSVDASIYFHTNVEKLPVTEPAAKDGVVPSPVHAGHPTFLQKCARASRLLWTDFTAAFTNWYVLKWSLWWALATCSFNMAYTYIQLLWTTVATEGTSSQGEMQTMYNGAVEAAYTLLGAAAAFCCGCLRLNWELLGDATMAGCALVQAAALIFAAYATDIWVAYLGYVVCSVLYLGMLTIVSAEIARNINEDSYGLIFGINSFFAVVLQTILTVVVAGEGGLALDIRTQFVVYGCFLVGIGVLFSVIAIVTLCRGNISKRPLWLPKDVESAHK